MTDRLLHDEEFSSKEFLLAVIHKDNKLTDAIIDFENVEPIAEGENEFEELNHPDDAVVCDAFMENTCTQASTSSGTLFSFGSSISSVSQTVDPKTLCGLCTEREKDSLMECGQLDIPYVVFVSQIVLLLVITKNFAKKFSDQRTRRKELSNFRCPFDRCGKLIKTKVKKMILDN